MADYKTAVCTDDKGCFLTQGSEYEIVSIDWNGWISVVCNVGDVREYSLAQFELQD